MLQYVMVWLKNRKNKSFNWLSNTYKIYLTFTKTAELYLGYLKFKIDTCIPYKVQCGRPQFIKRTYEKNLEWFRKDF